mgnify:FL=1
MNPLSYKRSICIFVQIIFVLTGFAQTRYNVILDKFIEKRNSFESMSYVMELKLKGFSDEDTQSYSANVELVRIPNDTLYGGNFSIQVGDSLWYGYNGSQVMRAVLQDSTLTIADIATTPYAYVKSTWADNFLDYGFLKRSQGPKGFLRNPDIKSAFVDTIIGDWPCLGIFFKLPDEDVIQNQTVFMAIDTIEYLVRNRMYSAFFQENEQYTNWLFKNVSYGHDSVVEKLDITFESNFQHVEHFIKDTMYEEEQNAFDYSLLAGKPYNKDETFKLADIKTNFIILDFWYSSCYPCIKGIPSVNKLYRDYKDKGVAVYGVNMVDEEEKSKARLEKFFKNNIMEYPPIMIDPAMTTEIGIRSFPTLLVLDKEYKIVYMEDGFSEQLYEKVAAFLDTRL